MSQPRFSDVREQLFTAYRADDYGVALQIAEHATATFPDRDDETTFWIACLRARLNDPSGALERLEAGLARGLCWHPDLLSSDDDLASIRDDPRFGKLVSEGERRHAEIRASALRDPVIRDPQRGRAGALLLAIHGGSQR